MTAFLIGFLSSLAATAFAVVVIKWAWPSFSDKCLYRGIRIDGAWDIIEERKGKTVRLFVILCGSIGPGDR